VVVVAQNTLYCILINVFCGRIVPTNLTWVGLPTLALRKPRESVGKMFCRETRQHWELLIFRDARRIKFSPSIGLGM